MSTKHVWWMFGLFVIFSDLGCTYETVEEFQRETLGAGVGTPSLQGGDDAGVVGDAMSIHSKGAGRTKPLTRGVGTPTTVLSETFQDDRGEVAGTYTVQFSVVSNGQIPDYVFPTVTYAEILWAIGGVTIRRVVSVSNGRSVTGVGAGCIVNVWDATTVQPGIDPVPQYTVAASVSPGVRASTSAPPVYYPLLGGTPGVVPPSPSVFLAASKSITVPVPQNGGIVSVMVTAMAMSSSDPPEPVTTPPNVTVNQGPTGSAKYYQATVYPEFVPLDSSIQYINVANRDSNAPAWISVTFGVDG